MADSDKWSNLPATDNPLPSRRAQPREYTAPQAGNGYPNDTPNTQTLKTRGTGAATRGNKHSAKMG
jgi:hypothetical protein